MFYFSLFACSRKRFFNETQQQQLHTSKKAHIQNACTSVYARHSIDSNLNLPNRIPLTVQPFYIRFVRSHLSLSSFTPPLSLYLSFSLYLWSALFWPVATSDGKTVIFLFICLFVQTTPPLPSRFCFCSSLVDLLFPKTFAVRRKFAIAQTQIKWTHY